MLFFVINMWEINKNKVGKDRWEAKIEDKKVVDKEAEKICAEYMWSDGCEQIANAGRCVYWLQVILVSKNIHLANW